MRCLVLPMIALLIGSSCSGPFGTSRERAIERAREQVIETMQVAMPDLPHPEPQRQESAGGCALLPGLNSSKETLRYQVEVPLPSGDDGVERQERAVQHWVKKGGSIRELPNRKGPPSEVNYDGGMIMAFSTGSFPETAGARTRSGGAELWIVATTPCVPKE